MSVLEDDDDPLQEAADTRPSPGTSQLLHTHNWGDAIVTSMYINISMGG